MRKLVIQIPCFNEERMLPETIAALPRAVPGFDVVEWLVIDDGSSDATAEIARRCGVHHVVGLPHNQGLARAFMVGLEASLKAGADVIVNTDADNQYDARGIVDLVRPILDGRAQMVIGARPINAIGEFSTAKKLLQRIGSAVVRLASGTSVPDAPSGFRAIHRDAALRLCVFNTYTYTLETIIQAGRKNIPVVSIPVAVNPTTRPSRLVKSVPSYILKSIITIGRIFVVYKPLRFFALVGTLFLVPGLLLGLRFTWYYFRGDGVGHVQSLILAAILIVTAVVVYAAALLSDLIATNRLMLEEIRTRQLAAEVAQARAGRDAARAGQPRSLRDVELLSERDAS